MTDLVRAGENYLPDIPRVWGFRALVSASQLIWLLTKTVIEEFCLVAD